MGMEIGSKINANPEKPMKRFKDPESGKTYNVTVMATAVRNGEVSLDLLACPDSVKRRIAREVLKLSGEPCRVELIGRILKITTSAVLFEERGGRDYIAADNYGTGRVWWPLSCVTYLEGGAEAGLSDTIEVPRWLLAKREAAK